MSKNLTLTIDEGLLRSARKVAVDRDTSVNQLVRDFLVQLVQQTDQRRAATAGLKSFFANSKFEVGSVTWTREDLHERNP